MTFVVATWNGIPANNSGKREVSYLTNRLSYSWPGVQLWTVWRSQAFQFPDRAAAEAAIAGLTLEHLRGWAKAYPNETVHVETGGIAGKELT